MSATLEQATLTAPDISCSHCVATIQKAVGGMPGVGKVRAAGIMDELGISPSRRVRGLGANQAAALRDRFAAN